MTSDLAQLNLATPFSGLDTIAIVDGSGLSISNVGSSILDVPQCSFKLPQVLHVPKLSQHLLSVYRLCKDNNYRFICDAFGFCIQDKLTGRVLLQGLCRDGLYPPFIHPTLSTITVLLPLKESILLYWSPSKNKSLAQTF
jgi:hypothetical protein